MQRRHWIADTESAKVTGTDNLLSAWLDDDDDDDDFTKMFKKFKNTSENRKNIG